MSRNRAVLRIFSNLRPMLLTLLLWLAALAPAFAAEPATNLLAPVDTSSPRGTFLAFRDNLEQAYRRWRLREGGAGTIIPATRALRTLDLRDVGDALLAEIGFGEAIYLLETLNRIDLPPLAAIPDAAIVQAQGLTRWTI